MSVKVSDNQSLFDIAIQTAGDATAAIALAIANDMPTTAALQAGTELKTVAVVTRDVVDYYNNKQLIPATAYAESNGVFDKTFDKTFA